MSASSPTVRLAMRLHRALLWLVPADVRREYGAEMIVTFAAAANDARRAGRLAVWKLLLHEILDLVWSRRANHPSGIALEPHRGGEWIQWWAWRQAWRSLARRPAFFAATVLTLTFGAGITTAVFSLVDTVLLKPLPYPDADALVTVYELSPSTRDRRSLVAPGRLEDWQRANRSFVAISATNTESVTDTSGQEPERLAGVRVAPRFFQVYGQPPLAGRWFTDDEERDTGPNAVVISERFWTRRFNRDPSTIGRALTIGGKGYPIVGIMPASFTPATTDVWLPWKTNSWLLGQREARFLNGVGRLKPGVTIEQAARDLALVQAELARQFPKTDSGWSVEVRSLKDARVDSSRRGLVLVFASVGALWLIAVTNIAGLTLVQVRRRARELAVRAALGASRGRAITMVWREGLIIGALGAGLGVVMAIGLVRAIPAILTATPRMNELTLDWRALSFTVVTTLLATVIVSVIPAVVGTRRDLQQMMAVGSRGVAGGRYRFQQGLVLAQVALSVALVGSATLLLRSYYNLTIVDRGFDPGSVVTFHVAVGWTEDRNKVGLLQTQLLTELSELPHVQAAGLTNFLPAPGGSLRYSVRVAGLTGPNADGTMTVGARTVTEGYLRAIRAPLVSGSFCPPFRMEDKPRSVMVNQRFLDMYAPNQNLVGRVLDVVQSGFGATYTIIGILGTMSEDGPAVSPVPFVVRVQLARMVAGSRVCRAHRRRAGSCSRSAADRQRDRFEARHLRSASAPGRRGWRVRSAEARCSGTELVCERCTRTLRHRPLQPVHAGRVGSHARDCGQARDRRLPERNDPAGCCRRRAVIGEWDRPGRRADGRGRPGAAWDVVRGDVVRCRSAGCIHRGHCHCGDGCCRCASDPCRARAANGRVAWRLSGANAPFRGVSGLFSSRWTSLFTDCSIARWPRDNVRPGS